MSKEEEKNTDAIIDEAISKVGSLNHIIPKVIQLANDVNSSARDIMKVMQLDPVLTAKALKLVNSAFFSLPQKVTSLGRAVILLGINTIRNLAMSCSVTSAFRFKENICHISGEDFWKYCTGVSVLCQLIAKNVGMSKQEVEEYFIVGLLHNIGKALMIQQWPEKYNEVITISEMRDCSAEIAEIDVFGFTHQDVGAHLVDAWKLPESIKDGITNYNTPCGSSIRSTHVLALACNTVKEMHIGFSGDYFTYSIPQEIWDSVGIDQPTLFKLAQEKLYAELEKADMFVKET
jgi:HD-like signal output (HDOD) protein